MTPARRESQPLFRPAAGASGHGGFYAAYGLRFDSAVALPHFAAAEPGAADVIVRRGAVPRALPEPKLVRPRWEVAQGEFLLRVEDDLRFRVAGGREITVECAAGADAAAAAYLMGSALTALLQQRGLLTLHASAVCTERGAVLFLGKSGAGKSTLAAALAVRGYEVLADDVSAISAAAPGPPLAMPGYPNLRLWADAFDRLGLADETRRRTRDGIDKYLLPLEKFAKRPRGVRAAYALLTGSGEHLELSRAAPAEAFKMLRRHTHRRRYIEGFGNPEEHFLALARLARDVPVTRVTRPAAGVALDVLVDHFERDLAG